MSRINNRDAVAPIARREAFASHTGSFRGAPVTYPPSLGRLTPTADELATLDAAAYVVWSYATPIAWWSEGHGWTVAAQRFSPTTSQHQGIVRQAVA